MMLNQNTALKSLCVGAFRLINPVLKPLDCNSLAMTEKMASIAVIP